MNMAAFSKMFVAAVSDRRTFPLRKSSDGQRPPLQILRMSFGILFFLFSSFNVSALTEENVNITRDAKSGGKLIVDVDFGTIEVAPGDNDKVVVNASRKITASSKDKEAEYFAAAPITVTSDGTTVVVPCAAREGLG